ncbi:MAG: class I SAM-dependent RNA methyltransferase [Nocardioides sp.]
MSRRHTRARAKRGASVVGQVHEVEIGPVAHGGFCVARLDGRAVFVRHALPGERARIRITEGWAEDRFWRADAIDILVPSADRVEAPCRYAGPDRCGGCDFQHVALQRQRDLKADVICEQLRRLAGIELRVPVEAVPGDEDGLRWRTRQSYVDLPGGLGMRKHRSHEVVEIDECLIAHPQARRAGSGSPNDLVTEQVGPHAFQVAADGFWQVHPGAPEVLTRTVMEMLAPQVGESALDLFSGVGLFSAFLAEAVGPTGSVRAVEGNARAVGLARRNVPMVDSVAGEVATVLGEGFGEGVDLVVLDPPREGARRAVVEQVVARTPRAVAYVACDPAALARDVAIFAELGYRLAGLRAFDLFPMTHHVECVALLTKTGSDLR